MCIVMNLEFYCLQNDNMHVDVLVSALLLLAFLEQCKIEILCLVLMV